MNLAFSHTGNRFFFITLAIEGRPEVLSELVNEQSRPRLTALGEIVKAAFVAVHQVWPAATLSDFVIMPDHLHFILIANYDISPGEVEALRRLKATPGTRFIKMLPCRRATTPRRKIRKHLVASHQFRTNCLAMNDLAAELCSSATGA